MKTRLNTLGRLRSLYAVVTHMHGVALEQATAAVRDAEQRIVAQRGMARSSSVAGLADLETGDKLGWMVHESQRALSEHNAAWLAGAREERVVSMRAAEEIYRENRVLLEQMQSVLQGLRAKLERERVRREQREADDRFLSRQRWVVARKAEHSVRQEESPAEIKSG